MLESTDTFLNEMSPAQEITKSEFTMLNKKAHCLLISVDKYFLTSEFTDKIS